MLGFGLCPMGFGHRWQKPLRIRLSKIAGRLREARSLIHGNPNE